MEDAVQPFNFVFPQSLDDIMHLAILEIHSRHATLGYEVLFLKNRHFVEGFSGEENNVRVVVRLTRFSV